MTINREPQHPHRRIDRHKLFDACHRVLLLARQYRPTEPHREMGYDGLLFGFLDARFGKMRRQYQITVGPSKLPKRLDFRQGGTSPVVIEFATRTRGRNEVYGSQNRSEIQKLSRQRKASLRCLILLDVSGNPPLPVDKLWSTYDKVRLGPGQYSRMPVQIVYIHPDVPREKAFHCWKP